MAAEQAWLEDSEAGRDQEAPSESVPSSGALCESTGPWASSRWGSAEGCGGVQQRCARDLRPDPGPEGYMAAAEADPAAQAALPHYEEWKRRSLGVGEDIDGLPLAGGELFQHGAA